MTPDSRFLPPHELKLWSLPDGAMVLKWRERRCVLGAPKRALPLSDPERFVVLFEADGQEIGTLRDVSELDEESQSVLRASLTRAYRIERITRILEVEREPLSGQTRWRVELALDDGDAPETETSVEPVVRERRMASVKPAVKRLLRRSSDDIEEPEAPLARIVTREHEFSIAGQEDVSTARYPHILIVDTERSRYEIPNCEALDAESRRAAERFF